jgi:hypothetical protein
MNMLRTTLKIALNILKYDIINYESYRDRESENCEMLDVNK